jgi:hypothetical protein
VAVFLEVWGKSHFFTEKIESGLANLFYIMQIRKQDLVKIKGLSDTGLRNKCSDHTSSLFGFPLTNYFYNKACCMIQNQHPLFTSRWEKISGEPVGSLSVCLPYRMLSQTINNSQF